MKVLNIHQRTFPVSAARVSVLIDSLSSTNDLLWPHSMWPRMKFDRPLKVAARGGHGPIRYSVEAYSPGSSVKFQFTGPSGFNGFHAFSITLSDSGCVLRHTLEMTTSGFASLTWPMIYRPLHDALIEDCLALAQITLGQRPGIHPWSLWVKLLRFFLSRGKSRKQVFPGH